MDVRVSHLEFKNVCRPLVVGDSQADKVLPFYELIKQVFRE